MKNFMEKYHDILIYLSCSILTALIEMGIGWNLLKILPDIVITNTIAILISSIIHYLITLKLVFRQKNTIGNVIIYVVTFVLGIVLQDLIIVIFYNYIFVDAGEFIRYTVSKILSLGIPFFVIYLLRSFLYKKYNSNGERVGK